VTLRPSHAQTTRQAVAVLRTYLADPGASLQARQMIVDLTASNEDGTLLPAGFLNVAVGEDAAAKLAMCDAIEHWGDRRGATS
jgi:hypothetical protein